VYDHIRALDRRLAHSGQFPLKPTQSCRHV
jgi:hypothetical protein